MGPRSNDRGNLARPMSISIVTALQWGRDLTIAEIPRWVIRPVFRVLASMGPRSNDRGNRVVGLTATPFNKASMGPRSNDRGNIAHGIYYNLVLAASMGPRSNDRGNTRPCSHLMPSRSLQWGRDLTIAEIRNFRRDSSGTRCFNGAAI